MSQTVILVTGGSGLVGQAMQKVVKEEAYADEDWRFTSSKDTNLLNAQQTMDTFNNLKPKYVLHLAALVGGLYKHLAQPLDMLRLNLRICNNVYEAARQHNCQKIVSCMSACIFPGKTVYPIDETMIHNGPPHNANIGYAYAKRMIDVLNNSYFEDHGIKCTGVIPTNIYGPHDNFSLTESNVLPGLIHKCFIAQKQNKPFIVSGSGLARRQFIFSEDLARLFVWTIRNYEEVDPLILTVSENDEISIKDLAEMIAEVFDFQGEIVFDTSKSDGQIQRTVTNKKLRSYLPDYKFKPIKEGIKETVHWFKENYPNIRLSY